MSQGVDVRRFGNAGGQEGEAEAALQRGAAHRFGRRAGPPATAAFGGKEQRGMPMRFPVFPQALQGEFGQRHVAIPIALASADVQEHALGIDVADFEAQAFAQAQAAGVNEQQADALIGRGHRGEHAADFRGGEHHRQFELGVGADQFQLVGPDAVEGFFPEKFEGADDLGAGLAGDPLVRLEVDAILAELLGGDQLRRLDVMLTELTNTGQISLFGARAERQERQVVGKGI